MKAPKVIICSTCLCSCPLCVTVEFVSTCKIKPKVTEVLFGMNYLSGLVFRFRFSLNPSSFPLPGELQPMASSASVASLVITVETGLSDEEGSMEQSQLGDKS